MVFGADIRHNVTRDRIVNRQQYGIIYRYKCGKDYCAYDVCTELNPFKKYLWDWLSINVCLWRGRAICHCTASSCMGL